MPTTAPLVSRDADAALLRGERPAMESNHDLGVVAAFSAIGIALTIWLALLFPLAANAVAIAWTVT